MNDFLRGRFWHRLLGFATVVAVLVAPTERTAGPKVGLPQANAQATTNSVFLPAADTTVRSLVPYGNDGTSPELSVTSASVVGAERALIRFDQGAITGVVGTRKVLSATLELTKTALATGWSGGTIAAYKMIKPWQETGATWACANDTDTTGIGRYLNNCTTANRWAMDWWSWDPRPFEGTPTAQAKLFSTTNDSVALDVTADVKSFLAGDTNNGWMLAGSSDLLSGIWARFSAKGGAAAARLIITYEQPTSPPPPPPNTLRVSVAATTDTFVSELFPDWVREGSTRLKANSDAALFTKHTLVYFSPSDIQARMTAAGVLSGSELYSAKLVMTVKDRWSLLNQGHTIDVHRMRQAWTAQGATWHCAIDSNPANLSRDCTTANSWNMLAAPAARPYEAVPSDSLDAVTDYGGEMVFDVTNDLARMLGNNVPNNGWLIQKPDQPWLGFISFFSKEGGIPPRLELLFKRKQCTASSPCDETQGPCASSVECKGGLECKQGVAWRFGITGTGGVCWDPVCGNPLSPANRCGSVDSKCGLCDRTSCTPSCVGRSCGSDGCGGTCGQLCQQGKAGCDSNLDCAAGLTCGVGNGARFGYPPKERVCWNIICDQPDQSQIPCGAPDSPCGTCPTCAADCAQLGCGADSCGNVCGACGSSSSCEASTRQCLAANSIRFPLPADVQVTTAPVGTIPGSFAVTNSGTARYTVPLEVPPGINGVQPELTLSYDSSQGDGYLGTGWAINGFSSIQRCRGTLATDRRPVPVKYVPADPLCLDGQRIVPVAAHSDSTGVTLEFRTELDTFTRIEARYQVVNGEQLSGPLGGFVVNLKDGRVLEYGTSDNSLIRGAPPVGPDDVVGQAPAHVWLLRTVRNRAGNAYRIRYVDHSVDTDFGRTREVYPEAIFYGGAAEGRDPVEVRFEFVDRGAAKLSGWRDGVNVQTNRLLSDISVHLNGQRIRHYDFGYEGATSDADGPRYRLAQVSDCNDVDVCKPATRFKYDFPTHNLSSSVELPDTDRLYGGDNDVRTDFPRFVLDLNGDGIDDFLLPVYGNGRDFIDFIYTPDSWVDWWTVMSRRTSGGIDWDVTHTDARIAFASGGSPLGSILFNLTPFGRLCQPGIGGQPEGGDLCPNMPGGFTNNAAGAVIDWNNDGRQELLEFGRGDEFTVLIHDGTSLRRVATGIESDKNKDLPYVLDANGDGLKDLLVCRAPVTCVTSQRGTSCQDNPSAAATWRLYLNDGGVSGATITDSPELGNVGIWTNTMVEVQTDVDCRKIGGVLDVDGDGADELVVKLGSGGTGILDITSIDPTFGALTSFSYTNARAGGLTTDLSLDINGDGLTDILHVLLNLQARALDVQIDINRGDGFFALSTQHIPYPTNHRVISPQDIVVWDENVDGRQDLLIPDPDAGWRVYRSNGTGFTAAGLLSQSFGTEVASLVTPADVNGDGTVDLVRRGDSRLQRHFQDGPPQDLLTTIIDGLGARTEVDYLPTSSLIYTHGSFDATAVTCHYPQLCAMPRRMLASQHREYDAPSEPVVPLAARTYLYTYAGGRSDALGRGWLGFQSRITQWVDGETTKARQTLTFDNETREDVHGVYAFAGLPKRQFSEVFIHGAAGDADDEDWISRTNYLYDVTYPTTKSVYAAPASAETARLIQTPGLTTVLGESSSQVTGRDDFGNITSVMEALGNSETRSTTRSYKHAEDPAFLADWLISHPTDEQTTSEVDDGTNTTSKVQHVAFTYFPSGFLKTVVRQPGDPELEQTTEYGVATDGALESIKVRDGAGHQRTTTFSFDGSRHYPTGVTNALGQQFELEFDQRFGEVSASQDPNDLLTQNGFDDFGRAVVQLRPDGSRSFTTYAVGSDSTHPMTVEELEVGGDRAMYEIDVRGRPIRNHFWGLGNAELVEKRTYDSAGLVASRTRPIKPGFGAPALEHTEYDELGRPTQFTALNDAAQENCYVGPVSCTRDARGSTRCELIDDQGRVLRVTAPITSTCRAAAAAAYAGPGTDYTYGPFGYPATLIDKTGRARVFVHDAFGRKTHASDPDRGNETYSYNGFDELEVSTNGRNLATKFEHDSLGRVTRRRDVGSMGAGVDGLTTFEWDGGSTVGPGELIGRLTRTVSPEGVERLFSFDSDTGQLLRQRTTIDSHVLDFDYAYDDFGRAARLTYPQGPSGTERPVIENIYDTYGHVVAVNDASAPPTLAPYWSASATDEYGAIQTELYRNQAATTRFYFKNGSPLEIIHEVNRTRFQDFEYAYDANENLERRTDLLRSQSEFFTYDEHDRLTHATGGGGESFAYDAADNIHKDFVNAVFHYQSAKPHALTSDGQNTFEYDGSGNRISKIAPDTTVHYDYTPFDTLKSVSTGTGASRSEVASFAYDAFQNRIKRTTAEGTTWFDSDLYERREGANPATEYVFYVANESRVVAQIIWREGSAPEVHYLHDDQLGSTTAISSGVVHDISQDVLEFSYGAFGDRRAPADWSLPSPNVLPSREFRRGFTGQENDIETGLIDMRGRTYDPATRQFMSVDPLMQLPFAEGLNGYSYVWNNPLKYIDPSGWEVIMTSSGPMNFTEVPGVSMSFEFVASQAVASPTPALTVMLSPAYGLVRLGALPQRSVDMQHYRQFNPMGSSGHPGALLDSIQSDLDKLSLFLDMTIVGSIVAWVPDLGNAGISTARKDYKGALLSIAAVVPELGAGANLARLKRVSHAAGTALSPIFKRFTQSNFRHNLSKLTGYAPRGAQAHHVLPVKFEGRFSQAGINIHDPRFGAWWDSAAHQKAASRYNDAFEAFFRSNPKAGASEILDFGRSLAQKYGLDVVF